LKKIVLTVTNDLTYDQRMQRICTALSEEGYAVTLVGRLLPRSLPLARQPYRQHRIRCRFSRGPAFYGEYNARLLRWLLGQQFDAVCAIDLDTVLPCYCAGRRKNARLFYDAHELFSEMKEVVSRPWLKRFWLAVERFALRRYPVVYTVSQGVADVFATRYGIQAAVIRNVPPTRIAEDSTPAETPYLLYQGAVNEGRGFEFLIPAMKELEVPLIICGDGNFMPQLRELIRDNQVEDRVYLKGMVTPDKLREYTAKAWLGLNFTENLGLNQYHCLPNKFFDYVHAGIPQVTNDYPEYRRHNNEYEVGLLLPELTVDHIVQAVRRMQEDHHLYARLQQNAHTARTDWNWEHESQKLVALYRHALDDEQ